jgi:acyl-phosphate glycerol 3-phosphate acyltransferase
MTDLLLILFTVIVAYLVGGIPFGYLMARARGVNIFAQGSGNIGATNVGRVLGRKFGIVVFVLDFVKGALPVALAQALAPQFRTIVPGEELGVVAGLAAVLGHLFPVYLRFRGGKGVATAAGVIVVLFPLAALAGLLAWIGVVSATRYVSTGSLAAAVALCGVRVLSTAPNAFARTNVVLTVFCFVVAGLVFVRHRANIARLLRGSENRLPEGGAMFGLTKVVHVMSLGLWFGTVIFFSFVVGLNLFGAMDELVHQPTDKSWFKVPAPYDQETDNISGPKEYGSRSAGHLISPMFGWYFLIQGICGFLAVATAWRWQYAPPEKLNRLRVSLLLAALATVVAGWPLERHVHDLRNIRHEKMDAYFRDTSSAAARNEAMEARSTFGLYHMYSLFLNFATMALVAASMGLAAFLPCPERLLLRQTVQSPQTPHQINSMNANDLPRREQLS